MPLPHHARSPIHPQPLKQQIPHLPRHADLPLPPRLQVLAHRIVERKTPSREVEEHKVEDAAREEVRRDGQETRVFGAELQRRAREAVRGDVREGGGQDGVGRGGVEWGRGLFGGVVGSERLCAWFEVGGEADEAGFHGFGDDDDGLLVGLMN